MTPSLLLTTLAPTPDTTNPLNADCTKRPIVLPPFGVITAVHPASLTGCSGPSTTHTRSSSTDTTSEEWDTSTNRTVNRTLSACPWTGAPIRAIVPLPRRKRVLGGSAQDEATLKSVSDDNDVPTSTSTTIFGLPCHMARTTHFWDDTDSTDSDGAENEERDAEGEDQGSDEDCGVASRSRFCSYESITAVGGLSAWSFEELRVECYAQSLVARGTKPPPVVQPSLAIPPAFVPRIVPRS